MHLELWLVQACSSVRQSISHWADFEAFGMRPLANRLEGRSKATIGFMRIDDSLQDFCMVLMILCNFPKKGQGCLTAFCKRNLRCDETWIILYLCRLFWHVQALFTRLWICPRPSGDIVSKATIRYPPSKDQLIGAQEGRLQRMSRALAKLLTWTWMNLLDLIHHTSLIVYDSLVYVWFLYIYIYMDTRIYSIWCMYIYIYNDK